MKIQSYQGNTGEYAEFPINEIKNLYLCRAAYEEQLIKYKALQLKHNLLEAEIKRLKAFLVSESLFITQNSIN